MSAIDLYNQPSPEHAAKVAHSIALLQGLSAQHTALTQASSLGAEDMVVTQLIHLAGVNAGIFVLDTGKLHTETLALTAQIEQRYQRSVEIYRPISQAVVKFVRQHGEEAMYQSLELRKQCCDLRKMEPLTRALAGKDGWITGLRREQSNARADVAEVVQDGPRLKISPLVNWTWGDVWHFIAVHQLPYNALHDQFFPSVGCAPCTRAIAVGEDFRSGRWWWENSENSENKECGLHVQATSALSPITEKASA